MTEMQRAIAEDVDLMEELVEKCLGTIGKKILDVKYINAKEENAGGSDVGGRFICLGEMNKKEQQ